MTFQTALQGWHTFYSIAGTSAAALVGLLFVGLALHLREVATRPDVRSLARVTLTSFAITLVLSLFMVEPGENPSSTGADILVMGACGLALVVPSLVTGLRSREHTIGFWRMLLRFGATCLACVGLMLSGGLFLSGDVKSGLDQLVPITIALLVVSVRNTWDILVSVGAAALARAERQKSEPPSHSGNA